MTEQTAFLALLLGSPKKWATLADQIEEQGSAIAVLSAMSSGQGKLFEQPASDASQLNEAEALIGSWQTEGMHFATLLDDDYPKQLLTIHQRPPFVMWRGTQDSVDAQGVAIVGTREASPAGKGRARALAAELADRGVTIVSGLAKGIDTSAHLGALEAGGRTVAVIGTGLRREYPGQERIPATSNRVRGHGAFPVPTRCATDQAFVPHAKRHHERVCRSYRRCRSRF